MAEFIAYLIAGIATGAIYALAAIGFTLVWQTSQTINFAQGEFVMLPAVLILLAVKLFGLPLWAGGLLGIAVFLLIFGVSAAYGAVADPNQFQPRAKLPQQLVQELIAEGLLVLQPYLPASIKVRESHQLALPMIHLDPRHKLTLALVELHAALA